GVEVQRSGANTGVEAAGGGAKHRVRAKCCVASTAGKTLKRALPFCRSEVRISAVGRRDDCLCLGRKAAKHTDNETYRSYFYELKRECIHTVLSFFFPPLVVLWMAGPEETKNLAGQESPPPDSNPLPNQSFTAVTVREDIGL